ncbi:MAG: SUMF1/EgtB/PvdO family nonheme iron enzyme [Pseudomonadota bacterium]
MMRAAFAIVAFLWASGASAQLLLPTPELRTERDCPVCPEVVILPDGAEISRAPVTLAEFRVFVEDTGYQNDGWGCKWNFPGFEQGADHPVVCVTFEGAQAYAAWLSQKAGVPYRLPTADELTYAVTANTATNYWWGQQIGRDRANCFGCGRSLDEEGTTPVGLYPANPFNLLDAVGNVWIWTTDCLDTGCEERVLLSGGWSSPPSDLRMTKRISNATNVPFNTYGVRVMREARE